MRLHYCRTLPQISAPLKPWNAAVPRFISRDTLMGKLSPFKLHPLVNDCFFPPLPRVTYLVAGSKHELPQMSRFIKLR